MYNNNPQVIILYGPTASGKSDFALTLAQQINGEIINMDMGQFYTPLSIGTAKPAWHQSSIKHHLFDIIDTPTVMSVADYRARLLEVLQEIWSRNKIPLLVGGSSFYVRSFFFPVTAQKKETNIPVYPEPEARWDLLNQLDPVRASQLHKNDMYRITRALDIWYTTGNKPSSYAATYNPPCASLLVHVTREREDLYTRINERTKLMIKQGWIAEVAALKDTPWQDFLFNKKIIGYDDILIYLSTSLADKEKLIETIAQKTRNYAKRQLTFARGLHKELVPYQTASMHAVEWIEANLTLQPIERYINLILNKIKK
jgi:tRNA dimethylallyltransferase